MFVSPHPVLYLGYGIRLAVKGGRDPLGLGSGNPLDHLSPQGPQAYIGILAVGPGEVLSMTRLFPGPGTLSGRSVEHGSTDPGLTLCLSRLPNILCLGPSPGSAPRSCQCIALPWRDHGIAMLYLIRP